MVNEGWGFVFMVNWGGGPGDLFIQMTVHHGLKSQLDRVVSAAMAHAPQDQDQEVQNYLQGLAPSNREALDALIKAAREGSCSPLTLDVLDSPAKDTRNEHTG